MLDQTWNQFRRMLLALFCQLCRSHWCKKDIWLPNVIEKSGQLNSVMLVAILMHTDMTFKRLPRNRLSCSASFISRSYIAHFLGTTGGTASPFYPFIALKLCIIIISVFSLSYSVQYVLHFCFSFILATQNVFDKLFLALFQKGFIFDRLHCYVLYIPLRL